MLKSNKTNIRKTYIELEVNLNGVIKRIIEGEFALKEFVIGNTIFSICPFLEVTLDGLIVGEPQLIEGMFINCSDLEHNVDVELFLNNSLVTILIQDRSSAYKKIKKLNQDRNELFILRSEINKQNKELENLRDIAEQASKNKSEFLAVMSHEIRNPLNVILGFGGLIESESHEPEIKEQSKYLIRAAQDLKILVNDLLNLSTIESGKFQLLKEPFSLENLIERSVKNFKVLLNDNAITLNFKTNKNLCDQIIIGDAIRLSQIIANLISNALKFTKKGSITLRADVTAEDLNNITVLFSIKDTGRGMSPESIKKIFSPYEQVELNDARIHGGTGLGLSIVKHLVEAMSGRINVESEIGVGSIFSFQVPFKKYSKNDKSELKIKVLSNNTFDFTQLKILIAEDDELTQRLSKHMLAKTGAKITVVNNGLEAMVELKNKTFSLVLLDINMPHMTGIEVIKEKHKFTELNEKTPVVATTANVFDDNIKNLLDLGFSNVLSKPYTANQFTDVILKLTKKLDR